MTTFAINLLSVVFIAVCLFMMLVILIQKPKGGGLSGAFGGAGGGSAQAVFGAKTGDVLTWLTIACFLAFILSAMGLVWATHPDEEQRAAWQDEIDAQTSLAEELEADSQQPDATPDATSDADAGTPTATPATDLDVDNGPAPDAATDADATDATDAP